MDKVGFLAVILALALDFMVVAALVPRQEVAALYDLYNATTGEFWAWQSNYTEYGIPWNFSAQADPCGDRWQGVLCAQAAPEEYNVVSLELVGYNLMGSLPTSLQNLEALSTLNLKTNFITGTIPYVYGNFSKLTYMSFYDNYLTGTLSPHLGNLTEIGTFSAYANFLSGTIPEDFGNLPNLIYWDLAINFLTGTLPASVGNLPSIEQIYLHNNDLTGSMPDSLGSLQSLFNFYVHNNIFTGTVPAFFGLLNNLEGMGIDNNYLTGTIPEFIGAMPVLSALYLHSNRLTGTMPASLGNLSQLVFFYLDNNYNTGTLPDSYGNLTTVEDFYVYNNYLTGTLPPALGSMASVQYIYMSNNSFSGTVPVQWAQLRTLRELQLQYNDLTGDLAEAFDPAVQTVLGDIQVNNNAFTGSLPESIFSLPRLNTFIAVSNCFEGTIPAAACSSQRLLSLVLDGLSAAHACRHTLFPGSSSAYTISKYVYGTLSSCLFQLQNLTTLHLSGNGFYGTLPSDVKISPTILDLALSHNQLSGSIPAIFQERKWYNLDLSYNKFSGSLHSGFGVDDVSEVYFAALGIDIELNSTGENLALENNRLSGRIPRDLQSARNISMLGSNLFSCDITGSDLPVHDSGASNYECGSNAFDEPYIIWLALAAMVVVVGALAVTRRVPQCCNELIEKIEIWWGESARLAQLDHTVRFLLTVMLCCVAFMVIVLLPVHCSMSSLYGTYTHQYTWITSAAFTSGITPLAWELVCLLVLLAILITSFYVAPFIVRRGTDAVRTVTTLAASAKRQIALLYGVYLFLNVFIVLGINIAFVYIAVYKSRSQLTAAQILLSLFKFAWNNICSSYLLRWARNYIIHDEDRVRVEQLHLFSLQVFISLVNNIVIPCMVVAGISPSCYYNVFVPAPVVNTRLVYIDCDEITADFTCGKYELEASTSTTYNPPFKYDYQCSSSLITYYAPAFVYLCMICSFVAPVAQCVHVLLHKRATAGTYWYRTLHFFMPRALIPSCETQLRVEKEARREAILPATQLLVSLSTMLAILMTFGAMFPPLAAALLFAAFVVIAEFRVKAGRFLHVLAGVRLEGVIATALAQCDAAGSVPLHSTLWMVVTVSCWFYTFFLFDTLGSAVGFGHSLWLLFVMPIMPVILYGIVALVQRYCAVRAPRNSSDMTLRGVTQASMELSDRPTFQSGGTKKTVGDAEEEQDSTVNAIITHKQQEQSGIVEL